MSDAVVPRPPSLPSTTEGLLAARKSMRIMTLNDYVDQIHVRLWERVEYRESLEAVYDEDAVEGSMAADNFVAAGMIRDYARDPEHPVPEVARKKLATIVKALNVVSRRFGMSRRQRAMTVGGVIVGEQNTHTWAPPAQHPGNGNGAE